MDDFDVNLLGMFDDREFTAQLERSKMGCQIIGETVFSLNQAKWQTLTVALARARVKITGLPLETFSFVQKEHVGIEPMNDFDLIGVDHLPGHPQKKLSKKAFLIWWRFCQSWSSKGVWVQGRENICVGDFTTIIHYSIHCYLISEANVFWFFTSSWSTC